MRGDASGRAPAGCDVRFATSDDVEEMAALHVAADRALGIEPQPEAPFLRWLLGLPYVEPDRDTWILARGGRVAAFGVLRRDPRVDAPGWWFGRVHPQDQRAGLGAWIVRRALETAAARAASGEPPFVPRTACLAQDSAAHALLSARGFQHVHTSLDMAMALSGDETPGAPPPGVTIRTFAPGRDERAFWEILETSFAANWSFAPTPYESHAAEWYGDDEWDPRRVFLAESDGTAVGACAWVHDEPYGYVATLGVVPAHRGRGIATALLRSAVADVAARGYPGVSLSVDAQNATGAVALYERVGMRVRRELHAFERAPTRADGR